MNITRLNSTNGTLLIRVYKIFVRSHMKYACTALITLNKSQSHRLEVIQNRCFRYARRTVDSTCICNDEVRSPCNIANVEQRILHVANNWWRKASNNNDDLVSFSNHHHAINATKTPLNVIKDNKFFHNH